MHEIKRFGFTLAEVLAALTVIGVIAILIIPALSKSINAKSRMSLLKNTVANIGSVVQKEMVQKRTEDIQLTDIYTDPEEFLNRFDLADSGEPFASSYKKLSGGAAEITVPLKDNKKLLKNGVGIGVINKLYNKDSTGIVIDVNGTEKPNIVGVDYFIVQILWNGDETKGLHSGDVGAYINGGSDDAETSTSLKSSCKGGNGAACYRMVELSGFNPDYLK